MSYLAVNGGTPVVDIEKAKFEWPRITDESEKAVVKQLHTSISIYDNSGIIGEFEKIFADYHNRKLGLLSNSGTSAIFSMFEGIGLMPGDEVICPVYTFHASVSPLINTGAIPIFADSDEFGNISIDSIKTKLTPRTKAVVVTHMWGTPTKDINKIQIFCRDHNLFLLEDCSHAHGSSIYTKKVGSFGDAAAWSLQGQKTITGGEGGIMLTDNTKIFNRALLQGHYNKRPKNEISSSETEYKFFLTGMGLKLRAHPLAIALALQQFNHLDTFISQRQKYANIFTKAFNDYPFFTTPETISKDIQSSWYAYILLFNENESFGVSREEFVSALHAEGLIEVDIPGSTGLLNELPLFTKTNEIMPRLYNKPIYSQGPYPIADKFYNSVIKLPVWTFEDEYKIVDSYISGIQKVADHLMEHKSLAE